MSKNHIPRTLVTLLRVCLLAALLAGFAIPNQSPLAALAQSSGGTGVDESITSPAGWNTYSNGEMLGGTWMKAGATWSGRSCHTSVVLADGSIVLMGGTRESGYYHDAHLSSDGSAAWWTSMTAAAGWSGRSSHTSVVLSDDSIVLMGGNDKNDVWRSTDKGVTWTEMTAGAAWGGRSGHTSVVLSDGSIILMGGDNGSSHYNDVWRSTDQGATWTQVTAGAAWAGRSGHTSVVLSDGSIILMGGNDGTNRLNDVWRSTDQGATWTQVTASAAWTARNGHTSVVLTDGSIVLMGGYSGSYKDDVWRSTDQGATWTQMTGSAAWHSRSAHTSVALPDGSIILMGGFYKTGLFNTWYGDVWRSTDQGATWTIPYSAFGDRTGHTSLTLPDSSIVVMGGRWGDYTQSRNDVWRSTDQGANWTNMTYSAVWADRFNHSSVVLPDGSLVLMGGRYKSGYADDVRRSTDQGATWTTMTMDADWSGRSGHTSVALSDGSIVLMGGYSYDSASHYYNDVWRSTDNGATWTQMTASAAWAGRRYHTSVVLPDDSIILMGGFSYDGAEHYNNDVWRSTDNGATWTEITSSAEWTGRQGHTRVVLPDGSLVLMGGYAYDGADHYYNDVWYSTDDGATWTEITPSAEWTGRQGHTSVVLSDGSLVLIGGDGEYYIFGDVRRLKTLISSSYTTYLPLVAKMP